MPAAPRLVVLVTAAVLAAGLPGPASASPPPARPAWTPTVTLSATSSSSTFTTTTAVNDRGDAMTVYDVSTSAASILYYARRPAGRAWTKPKPVAGQAAGSFVGSPTVALTADGRALLVWVVSEGASSRVRSTTFSAAGVQGAVLDVSSATSGQVASALRMDMNPAGRAAVTWVQNGTSLMQTTGVLGTFNAGAALSEATGSFFATDVEVDDAGDALFIWERDLPDRYLIEARARRRDGVMGPVQLLTPDLPGARAEGPDLAMTPQGQATAAWGYRSEDPALAEEGRYAVRSAGADFLTGSWSGQDTYSLPGQLVSNYGVSVAALGADAALIGYSLGNGGAWATVRRGGGFTGHQKVSGPGLESPVIRTSAGRGGTGVLVFGAAGGTGSGTAGAALLPRGSTATGSTRTFPTRTAAAVPSAGVDDQGNVHVVVGGFACASTCGQGYVGAAAFDGAAPSVQKVAAPKKLTAGAKGTFKAKGVFDRISAVTARWTFGDGSKAKGTKVKHAFAKPGTFKVKLTLTDAVGNQVTRKVKVKVIPK